MISFRSFFVALLATLVAALSPFDGALAADASGNSRDLKAAAAGAAASGGPFGGSSTSTAAVGGGGNFGFGRKLAQESATTTESNSRLYPRLGKYATKGFIKDGKIAQKQGAKLTKAYLKASKKGGYGSFGVAEQPQ